MVKQKSSSLSIIMLDSKTQNQEIGFVIKAQDYLLSVEGLPHARVNDLVMTQSGDRGLVAALSDTEVEIWMLDSARPKPGDTLTLTSASLKLPLSANLFGRMINPLGVAMDGGVGFPPARDIIDLDIVAPGIDARSVVSEQFYTGLTMIDTLIPIGKGQRELIFGEARSGKTSFLLDVIVHQKHLSRVCIYAALGKSDIDVKRFTESVISAGAGEYTVIIGATSSQSAPSIAIAPSVASAVAEYYRSAGRDVLLILDDLATHAKYLREIGLLAGRIPGRESYPADIFFQHSRIVERAGNFNDHFRSGSITLLPVIETDIENFTNLIPTNVMSMTDGHILFSSQLRAKGQYPAVEPDRSVTRVGRQTQKFLHKVLSDRVRSLLADFHELERYGRFGSELSMETQLKIKRGKVTEELLKQEPLSAIEPAVQILLLSLVFTGFFDVMDIESVRAKKSVILKTLDEVEPFKGLKAEIEKINLDELITKIKLNLPTLEALCRA